MGSYFMFHDDVLCFSGESDVWRDEPTPKGTILYSVITPIICSFGICGNTLSLMVLKRRELVGSVYTYLAVLAAMDLLMSIMLFVGGLSRGALYYRGWATYDALVGLPLGGAINSLSVIATVGVTIDRVLYLWNPVQCTKPRFCHPRVARKLMAGALVGAVVLNVPYCFIFAWDEEDHLVTTDFFDSMFYTVFNWCMLVSLSIIPGVILILGNGFLIMSLRRAREVGVRCKGKKRDHTNLTITLISIIILFVISEIPAALVSRTSAVSILFSGDHERARSRTLEVVRQVCTLLGAINVTINFLIYYLFCPAFCKALVKTFRKGMNPRKSLQVNVFVLKGNRLDEKTRHSINDKMKVKILEMSRRSAESAFPSSLCKGTRNTSEQEEKSKQANDDSEYVEIVDGNIDYNIMVEDSSENSSAVVNNTYDYLY